MDSLLVTNILLIVIAVLIFLSLFVGGPWVRRP
jgi:hypothetical protein